ncbi:electron transfer flavoprotein [Adlercreutzia sp. ZJ141]|uniref:electron transfer flavoprotein n=1 Tax=Adlercreutzia sp. ZJ141 TaxID=2709406 RepID=UPI0013E9D442|nr:electron transfer flavoprotein [Adlercreutzia sp. ZJ141]
MKILVAFKILPDDQDIRVAADGSLDFSKAKPIVSSYDANAMEEAAQLAKACGAEVVGITVGSSAIDDSKVKKNALSRGLDRLVMVADDTCDNLDSHATAAVLTQIAEKEAGWDLILCGDGSADNYAQQVDVQLAAALGAPSVNGVTSIKLQDGCIVCERALESSIETVEVSLPAVVSVTPSIAEARVPGMKDILAAGKKPVEALVLETDLSASVEVVSVKAPDQASRACEVLEAGEDRAIEKVAAAIRAAL